MKRIILFICIILMFVGCSQKYDLIPRESKIPEDSVKINPETDLYPPILHSDEYERPVPLDAINSAGAEDSPFIPIDRDEIYFFFTPDVRVPVEKQVLDGVTGIYVSKYENRSWQTPERVMLQKPGKLSLDGCEFIEGDFMLFCTAREGYTGIHWATAEMVDGIWKNWKVDDFPEEYKVGELHIHGNELYYHSDKEGGKGGIDIWMLRKEGGEWNNPVNIKVVNTADNEGWPYISADGNELWFNRFYQGTPAVFRSKKINDVWQEPELIVSQFAGEPTLDKEGNLYFVHHYYKDAVMLEADIYVAYKKQ